MNDISIEEFKEYEKIASFTFSRFFKRYKFLKDDLIAFCLSKLNKICEKYDETKGAKTTYFVCIFRGLMFRFLSAEFGWGNYKKKIETVSLETPTKNGDDIFASFIPGDLDFDKNLNFEFLKKCLNEIYNDIKVSKNNHLTKPIIKLICQGCRDIEISQQLNCSRELARQVRLKLASLLKIKLEEKEYFL